MAADASFVVNPHLYSKLSYDPINDFVPISGLGISPQALLLHPSVPANTFGELVASPRPSRASSIMERSASAPAAISTSFLESETGAKFTPVHYRGAAPAITDLLGGHIQMMIVAIGLVQQNLQAGKLKALGIGTRARCRNIPTCRRSRRACRASWPVRGTVLRRPGHAAEIVDRLSAETQKIFGDPAFRDKFLAPAVTFSIASPPAQFAERISAISRNGARSSRTPAEGGVRQAVIELEITVTPDPLQPSSAVDTGATRS